MTFSVPVTVRGYELDVQGHVNQAVYLQYAEHARWECLLAAGLQADKLVAARVGPVVLESTIKYRRELRGGDDFRVTCAFEWGSGKTYRIRQEMIRTDGTLSAEVSVVGGLLDLDARRLVADPPGRFRELATHPDMLGL
ncbi:acyl-CoA thioesterase [Nocardia sienata]|uniref:acyl-CoA thioesterase n=1 Tax=Nocardia sienata TaxID=248552 RepID=UPI0007A41476|nr:acyl-CoA thioesterase [Nocardia sienata]